MNSGALLHDLSTHYEWKLDRELEVEGNELSYIQKIKEVASQKKILLWNQIPELHEFIKSLSPWQLSIADAEGQYLGVLQNESLQIRRACDNYESAVGCGSLHCEDPHLEYRKIAFSPDCSLIAAALSSGLIYCYDCAGNILFSIPSPECEPESSVHFTAYAAIFFVENRMKRFLPSWPFELITCKLDGNLNSYFVSAKLGFKSFHKYAFSSQKRRLSVSAAAHLSKFSTMLVAFQSSHLPKKDSLSCEVGLTAWKLTTEWPYNECLNMTKESWSKIDLASWKLFSVIASVKSGSRSVIVKMCVNSSEEMLACLHSCATISLWYLPSLKLKKVWNLIEQPDYIALTNDNEDSNDTTNEQHHSLHANDINWCDNENLIIARRNGAISVCDSENLTNQLNNGFEFVDPGPSLANVCDLNCGILIINCCVKRITSHAYQPNSSYTDVPMKNLSNSNLIRKYIFSYKRIFENEKPITHNLIQKTYQLLSLRKLHPEEVLARFLDNCEYSKALDFAESYNLDKNRVYQRQWRNSAVSEITIESCLSKITNRTWVLYECLERIPQTISAAEMLLNYGLKLTDFDKFLEMRENEKLVIAENDFSKTEFTSEQINILQIRRKLLSYKHVLKTYELILGKKSGRFRKNVFEKFRLEGPVAIAIDFAKERDCVAMDILFEYYGHKMISNWLKILDNIPDVTAPKNYANLLPKFDKRNRLILWTRKLLMEEDWCQNEGMSQYTTPEHVDQFSNVTTQKLPTTSEISTWYRDKALNIESNTGLVENASELLELALKNNIPDIDRLRHQLLTLSTLVYEIEMEDMDLEKLRKKSESDVISLLMSKSDRVTFVRDFITKALPFANRCEKLNISKKNELLRDYLRVISQDDISQTYLIFKYMSENPYFELVDEDEEKIELAIECLYANKSGDQIDTMFSILECLPNEENCEEKCKEVECELSSLRILKNYGYSQNLSRLNERKNKRSDARDILMFACDATVKKLSGIGKSIGIKLNSDENELKTLLDDLLHLRAAIFDHIFTLDEIYEIYAFTLINSGNSSLIKLCQNSLTVCSEETVLGRKLSYRKSINVIAAAVKNYINSSISYEDAKIDLAKICISFAQNCEDENISNEKRLLNALKILNEFCVRDIMPKKLRECENCSFIIDNCFSKNPKYAADNVEKIIELFNFLNIDDSNGDINERMILKRGAELSFEFGDYKRCAQICLELSKNPGEEGWDICARVCSFQEYPDIEFKRILTNRAILNCPASYIIRLNEIRNDLELKWTAKQIDTFMNPKIENEKQEGQIDGVKNIKNLRGKDILNTLGSFKKTLQTTSSEILNAKYLKTLFDSGVAREDDLIGNAFNNKDGTNQGFPYHYSDLHFGCSKCVIINEVSENNEVYNLMKLLLRHSLLQQYHGNAENTNSEICKSLLHCGVHSLKTDCFLAICCLIPLSCEFSVEAFQSAPSNSLTYNLAAYCYSVKFAIEVKSPLLRDILKLPPTEFIEKILLEARNSDTLTAKTLNKYVEIIKREKSLSLRVNVESNSLVADKLVEDAEYKIASIIELSMKGNKESFDVAANLAEDCDEQIIIEMIMSHLTCLLNLDIIAIQNRLSDPDFLKCVRNSDEIVTRLTENIYPNIDGTDYRRLIAFYTILGAFAENEINKLRPKDHVRLLKRVKAITDQLDYKMFTLDYEGCMLGALKDAVTQQNVASLVRLCRSLPNSMKNVISSTDVYSSLVRKIFYENVEKRKSQDWLQAFEACCEYFGNMAKEDVVTFVKEALAYVDNSKDSDLKSEYSMIARQYYNSVFPNDNHLDEILKTGWDNTSVGWEDDDW